MNAFKKKSLYAALAGVSALGVVNVAQAVNVNADGTGQVLIYPYYTTRADALGNVFSTLISVVNTQNSVKAVKVRFLEGKNSREVLDFNLFLSPYDVWTGAVMPDAGGGAKIATRDKSCTLPVFPASGEVAFVNYAYTGSAADGGDASLDRTKEGYIEIIEMVDFPTTTTTAKAVTHVNGVAPCSPLSDAQARADGTLPPTGGLFGGLQLVNALTGTAFSSSATALDNYKVTGTYYDASSPLPRLDEALPPISQVLAGNAVYTSTWAPSTANPVSAVLMHNNVLNEYVLDANTASRTDWVVTFPTKGYYVSPGTGTASGKLFQRNFNKTDGSCDDVTLAIYDREEQTSKTPLNFSPPPPTRTAALCWEANVLSFTPASGGSTTVSPILGSTNVSFIPYVFQNGWLNLGFGPGALGIHQLVNTANTSITTILGSTTTGNTVTYQGLPVVGFAAMSYTNGSLNVGTGLVQSSYGVDFGHRYTTVIQ